MDRFVKQSHLAILLIIAGACASAPPPTPVANVADVATKIEQSANVILQAAQTGNQTAVPSTGKPLVTRGQLDQVAIGVNKLGHLGLTLRATLDDYNTFKAAGKDVTFQTAAVNKALADVTSALNIVGVAIPQGTIATIDQEVASMLALVANIKGRLQ